MLLLKTSPISVNIVERQHVYMIDSLSVMLNHRSWLRRKSGRKPGRNAHFYKNIHWALSVFQNRTKTFFEILCSGNLNFGYPWYRLSQTQNNMLLYTLQCDHETDIVWICCKRHVKSHSMLLFQK